MLNKKVMRQKQLQKIHQWWLENADKKDSLYQNLFQNHNFKAAQTVAITISMADELPTQPIIQRSLQLGKKVYIPKTYSDYSMKFFDLQKQNKLQRSSFGVWEPMEIEPLRNNEADITIVPALAVALANKQRLGFGAGYYDRYLAQVNTVSLTVALPPQIFTEQIWSENDYDYAVNQIITTD